MPPAVTAPPKCKPRTKTGYDLFIKSEDAPKGENYVITEGGHTHCDLKALQRACRLAWGRLSDIQREHFHEVAVEMQAELGADEDGDEDQEDVAEPVA